MISNLSELEAWILSYLATTQQYTQINAKEIIEQAPQSIIMQIESKEVLVQLLHKMKSDGLLSTFDTNWNEYDRFQLGTDGMLAFRKFLNPLIEIAQDNKKYNSIINKTAGSEKTKKEFKKFLASLKGKLPDQASDEIIDFLRKAGKEAIFYAVRMIVEN